ncbi:MAG: DNA polymerase Y family protein [Pseudomonadota bacterium]
MLWLAIHYPLLGLEVLTPDDEAAIVVENNRVYLANEAALQRGIQTGSTLASAIAIAGAHQLTHLSRNPQREHTQLNALAEALYQLSPQVALAAPDGLVLEIQASLRLFGNAQAISQRAELISFELGFRGRCRLAATPAAAIALARAQAPDLERLPLHALALPAAAIERFQNMGLVQVGPVLKLPDRAIARRFGKATLKVLRQLRGDTPDPQRFIEPAAEFERQRHLLDPIRSKQGVLFPAQRMLKELEHWLIGRQLAVAELHWLFSNSQNERADVILRFSTPHQNADRAFRLLRLKLEHLSLPADVLSLTLQATRLEPCVAEVGPLFQTLEPAEQQRCPDELLDQLRTRLGEGACCTLIAPSQHHPDWLSKRVSVRALSESRALSETRALSESRAPGEAKTTTRDYRPLWLCRPPQPISPRQLRLLHGPERVRTAWWHGGVERDYYVAEHRVSAHQTPAQCWAFNDEQDRWFIHGYFG